MRKRLGLPIANEGWPFIVPLAVITILLFSFGWHYPGTAFLILTLFVLFFFRDPDRKIPEGRDVLVSPADGKVVMIKELYEPDYLKQNVKQISIFLSVFNVHINRSPMKGVVERVSYQPGKFHAAFLDKASQYNEQTAVIIADRKRRILVKQIAGVLARRIVCNAKPGDMIQRGERYGIIRFGSRVDLFLPNDAEIRVTAGDTIKGGQDILGVLK
ncbi:MAG: phosphatidylserine decarboxylase family protein [Nitrospirota bacterium]